MAKMVETQQGSTAVSDTVFGGWGRGTAEGIEKKQKRTGGHFQQSGHGAAAALGGIPPEDDAKLKGPSLGKREQDSTGVKSVIASGWAEGAPPPDAKSKRYYDRGGTGVEDAFKVAPNWQGSLSWRYEEPDSEYSVSQESALRSPVSRGIHDFGAIHEQKREGQSNLLDKHGIFHPELGHSISAERYGVMPSGEVKPMNEMFEGFRIRAQPPQPVESACPEWPGHTRGRDRASYPEHSVFNIPRKAPVVEAFQWEDKRKRHAYRFHDKEMRHGKKQFRNERYVEEGGYGGKWDCAAQWWVHDSPDQVTCHGRLLSSRVVKDHKSKVPHSTTSELYAGLPPRSQGSRSFGGTSDAFSDAPVMTSAFHSGRTTPVSAREDQPKHKFAPAPRPTSTSARSERTSERSARSQRASERSARSERSQRSYSDASITRKKDAARAQGRPAPGSHQGSLASRESRNASVASRSESRVSSRSGYSGGREYVKPTKGSGSRGSQSTMSGSVRSRSESHSSRASLSSRTSRTSSRPTVSTQPHTPVIQEGFHPAIPAGARSMIEQLWQ